MKCAICGTLRAAPFTTANVPLCDGCYTAWLREESCKAGVIWAAMGWDGNLTTATKERTAEFHAELSRRTVAWADAQAKARAA